MSESKSTQGFTAEERAAMRERAKELKANASRAEAEREVLKKIAEMPPPDRALGERLHALIKSTVPSLSSRTWYGMPAYAKDDEIVCFFQPASKFKVRYATLGFSDEAKLDEGQMWPVTYAIRRLTPADEVRIAALLKRAVGP
ncbi:MAG TPA: DUF1801 domain-containing protein [Thermoplasmata archaeon]|nr:DUF1801 domain-containing protein [Thermoplasmata archaeon]